MKTYDKGWVVQQTETEGLLASVRIYRFDQATIGTPPEALYRMVKQRPLLVERLGDLMLAKTRNATESVKRRVRRRIDEDQIASAYFFDDRDRLAAHLHQLMLDYGVPPAEVDTKLKLWLDSI